MSLHKEKAEEILELCLANESPQMRSKVAEILSLSGIQPNDPMFLVLALTGQMRVFLEAAPVELGELLRAWKIQNTESIKEISEAIALIKEAQSHQIEKIKQSIEVINFESVEKIKQLNKQTLAEILSANVEVEQHIKQSVEEIKIIKQQLDATYSEIKVERNTNVKLMKALIEGVSMTNSDLEKANSQIQNSISTFQQLKSPKILNKWLIWGSFLCILTALSLGIFDLVRGIREEQSNNVFLRREFEFSLNNQIKLK